jgi:hypothetical protein
LASLLSQGFEVIGADQDTIRGMEGVLLAVQYFADSKQLAGGVDIRCGERHEGVP